MTFLLDTHGHYDFLPAESRADFLATLHRQGVRVVAQTVLPSEFVALKADLKKQAAEVRSSESRGPSSCKDPGSPEANGQAMWMPCPHGAGTPTPEAGARLALPLPSLGFHPWYIGADADEQLEIFAQAVRYTRLIGEIGLDFAPRRLEAVSQERQEQVFVALLNAVAKAAGEAGVASNPAGALSDSTPGVRTGQGTGQDQVAPRGLGTLQGHEALRGQGALCGDGTPQGQGELDSSSGARHPFVLSIHAVHSAGRVLELFADYSVAQLGGKHAQVVPIIHWFSGTSQELSKLIELGGYISINAQMLKSKRGRAYIKQIPADRLLLETDLPDCSEAAGALAESGSNLGELRDKAGGTSAVDVTNPGVERTERNSTSAVGKRSAGVERGTATGVSAEKGSSLGEARTQAGSALGVCAEGSAVHGHAHALKIAHTLTGTLTAVSELRGEDMRGAILANQRRLYGELMPGEGTNCRP